MNTTNRNDMVDYWKDKINKINSDLYDPNSDISKKIQAIHKKSSEEIKECIQSELYYIDSEIQQKFDTYISTDVKVKSEVTSSYKFNLKDASYINTGYLS